MTDRLKEIGLMEVGGFSVGHAGNEEAGTGCTVFLFDEMSPAGLDVRGGGPASRESQLLNPLMSAWGLHAVLLSGGSAYGLDAAGGVLRYLEEKRVGLQVGSSLVPLVCQSCVFDLEVGNGKIRPDADMAYEACKNASRGQPAEGNAGGGLGCSVGKLRGMERAMKSGFGTYAVQTGDLKVGAAVMVNAAGDVYDEDGHVLAGVRTEDGTGLSSTIEELLQDAEAAAAAAEVFETMSAYANTTLGVIVTNARFSKTRLCKIAGMAHNGYARSIRPVHTSVDGDSIYAVSTGNVRANPDLTGTLAAYAMERAVRRAVRSAAPAYGLPGLG